MNRVFTNLVFLRTFTSWLPGFIHCLCEKLKPCLSLSSRHVVVLKILLLVLETRITQNILLLSRTVVL